MGRDLYLRNFGVPFQNVQHGLPRHPNTYRQSTFPSAIAPPAVSSAPFNSGATVPSVFQKSKNRIDRKKFLVLVLAAGFIILSFSSEGSSEERGSNLTHPVLPLGRNAGKESTWNRPDFLGRKPDFGAQLSPGLWNRAKEKRPGSLDPELLGGEGGPYPIPS